jgi:hypothetical protein
MSENRITGRMIRVGGVSRMVNQEPSIRSPFMRKRFVVTAMMTFAIPLFSVSAQLVFKVCRETCPDPLRDPAGAAMCQARITLCETKLTAYNGYMGQLGAGTTTVALPAVYREVLQPFYSGNLANWRFALGDRQPPNNATTDCNVTYFNKASYVNHLRNGDLDADWEWLFHELRHFGQCSILGSRDAYAKMWFGHLELAFIQSNDLATLHDRMWMENDAENFESTMLQNTRRFRDIHNHLVRPISVSMLNSSGATVPDNPTVYTVSYRVTAKITGGSDPLDRQWWLKRPGMTTFEQVTGSATDNRNTYELNTTAPGSYTLRVLVQQIGSNLSAASRQVVINVLHPRKGTE